MTTPPSAPTPRKLPSPFADVRLKRQFLRWLIQKRAPLTHDVLDILRVLLTDRDWEVRMTAMFAAGRLNIAPLRSLVDRTPVPYGSAEGLDTRDQHMLVAARQVIVAHLNGFLTPDQFDATLARIPGVPPDFARAVIGLPVEHMTRDSLLIHALTVPADTQVPQPALLPPGIIVEEGRYFLTDTGIEFVWISPIDHWLGDDPEVLPTPNPIRLVTLEHGYFIAQYPLSALQFTAAPVSSPVSPPEGRTPSLKPEYLTATFDAAQHLCENLSRLAGASLHLPTADEWEMAARGPDGRRYPSGNSLDRDMLLRDSPWGVYHAVGVVPQWAQPMDDRGQPLICGRELRCAARSETSVDTVAAIRPVVQGPVIR